MLNLINNCRFCEVRIDCSHTITFPHVFVASIDLPFYRILRSRGLESHVVSGGSWFWILVLMSAIMTKIFLEFPQPLLQDSIVRLKRDGTRAETRFRLSPKGTSPFKSVGTSAQLTTGSRGVPISGSNAGYTMFRGCVRVLTTHSIRQFPLHFSSRASPCAIRFQTHYTSD